MKQLHVLSTILLLICCCISQAQQPVATDTTVVVPPLVNFSGVLTESNGKAITVETPVTFMLYKESQGASPLWMESQNVKPDSTGHYSVMLGATSSQGLPAEIFVAGQAHWLAVQVQGQEEQPRVLLVSAPYALKAGDAETIGGLPPTAFVLANSSKQGSTGSAAAGTTASSTSSKTSAPPANPAVTGKGVAGYVPVWDTTSDIVDSVMFQKSSQIGFGTTSPTATIDVNGKGNVRDTLTLFPKSTDNTLAVSGTTFKISSTGTVTFITGQKFPGTGTITGITTSSTSGLQGGGTSGTLNLSIKSAGVTNAMLQNSKVTLNANTAGGLTTPGAMTLGSTYTIGLKPCSTSQVLQYNGTSWNCAAAGTGTITGVTAGSGLSGGGTGGNVTLSVKTAGITNAMLQNSAVTVAAGTDLTGGGSVALGGTTTLNLDTTKVPSLAAANAFTNSDSFTGTPAGPEVNVTNNGTGDALDLFSAGGYGLFSQTNAFDGGAFSSSGTGFGSFSQAIADSNFNAGAAGWEFGASKEDIGVWGFAGSTVGIGNYAEAYSASTQGTTCCAGGYSIGLWADTSGSSGTAAGIGALTTVDNGYSLVSYNNSTTTTAWIENDVSGDSSATVLVATGAIGFCEVDVSGNLTCSGTITPAVPVNGGAKKVALYSMQSAENWFEDAGSGQLANGSAVVQLESTFAETVNTGVEYHVFLTPNGDCKGLYVSQKSATSFEVHELSGGTSNIAFDYRIMAKRRGYETVRLADVTKAAQLHGPNRRPAGTHGPNPDEVRKGHQAKVDELRKVAAARAASATAVRR